jgi:16S rRNA processing protein RimM
MTGDRTRVVLGRISGAHGIRGEVRIKPYTERPEDIGSYGPVTARPGGQEFRLKVVRLVKDGVIARIQGVTDRTAAEGLKGLELEVERTALPKAAEDEFYHADLIGLRVVDKDGRTLGAVKAVQNYGGGDILEIAPETGGPTVLMGFTRETVPVVDLANGRLVADPPAGVFEGEDGDSDDDGKGEDGG